MLPASLAACITSVTELLSFAPEIIRIALRLGIRVCSRSNSLERSTGSWALACAGVSLDAVQDNLAQFHGIYVGSYLFCGYQLMLICGH